MVRKAEIHKSKRIKITSYVAEELEEKKGVMEKSTKVKSS